MPLPMLRSWQPSLQVISRASWLAIIAVPIQLMAENPDHGWHGLWVPKGTPKEIVTKLNGAVRDTLADSAVRQRLAALSLEIPSLDQQTPEGLYAQQRAEIEKWWPIIKGANLKGE